MDLLYLPRKPLKKDYIDLEIWSKSLDKPSLREHTQSLVEKLGKEFDSLEVLKFKWNNYLEIYRHLFLAAYGIRMKGYLVRLRNNMDNNQLKQICMDHELNLQGKRVSDIDIYLPNDQKISRKLEF